jgi:methionyl-tRNA formyltransferase
MKKKLATAVFLGSKDLGLSILKALHGLSPEIRWTVLHPEDGSDPRSNLQGFREFASRFGLDLRIPVSGDETNRILASLRPDIGFVCGWYWLLAPETLATVRNGLWGLHNSLLPRYRGTSPLVWSVIRGERLVGSTVFRLGEGLDDGEILHQIKVKCRVDDDIRTLLQKIEAAWIAELPRKWKALLEGRARPRPQRESQATYCAQRIEEDGLIDWSRPAREVHDFVRAQTRPYPCAFSFLLRDKVAFLKTRVSDRRYFGTPGQILRRTAETVLIGCGGDTALEVLGVSVNGADRRPPEYFRSTRHRMSDAPISRPTT